MSNKLPTESKIFTNLKRSVDDRGEIMSIVDTSVQNVSIIHCYENTIRSNHYHKIDFHFMYVLDGEIDYFYKGLNDNVVKYIKVLKICFLILLFNPSNSFAEYKWKKVG